MTQGNMAEYAVLDLRSNHTQPALHDHANLYHVLFAADFQSAELRLIVSFLPLSVLLLKFQGVLVP